MVDRNLDIGGQTSLQGVEHAEENEPEFLGLKGFGDPCRDELIALLEEATGLVLNL